MDKTILKEGSGDFPKPGQIVSAHYTGTLENGEEFDCSRLRGQPFEFPIGQRRVIHKVEKKNLKITLG